MRPEVRIIDYTGSTAFGDWLETNARQAQVYTEKAGVNTVVIDSTDDYKGMLGNLAFSLSLYSGQMCTTPQNLLIPRDGITTDAGPKSYDEVVSRPRGRGRADCSATTPGPTRCWAPWSIRRSRSGSRRRPGSARWRSPPGPWPTPSSPARRSARR